MGLAQRILPLEGLRLIVTTRDWLADACIGAALLVAHTTHVATVATGGHLPIDSFGPLGMLI